MEKYLVLNDIHITGSRLFQKGEEISVAQYNSIKKNSPSCIICFERVDVERVKSTKKNVRIPKSE